jgi:hypothetical protein
MKTKIENLRWKLADWLSFAACKLRGHKWYLGDSWYPVPGNRAADLRQQVWVSICAHVTPFGSDSLDFLDEIEPKIDELAQMAGENWGHVKHNGGKL